MNHDQEFIKGILRPIEERTTLLRKEIMSAKEASAYTAIPMNSLRKYCAKKIIPFSKPLNGRVYFLRSDLDAFMMSNPVKSNEQLRQTANQKYA